MTSPGISPSIAVPSPMTGLGAYPENRQPIRSPTNMTVNPPIGPNSPPAKNPAVAVNESLRTGGMSSEIAFTATAMAANTAR